MSLYEDYTRVASSYDDVRHPVGADLYASFIVSSNMDKKRSNIKILDAGCGTGNYSMRFITKHNLTNLTLLDANEAMITGAKEKIRKVTSANINYQIDKLPDIPFQPSTFDAIMINYVLHHLEKGSNEGYANTKTTLANISECLKPGGTLAITTVSQHQVYNGFWFFCSELVPHRVLDTIASQLMPVDSILAHLENLGFADILVFAAINESPLIDEVMKDHDGPLDERFRNSLSGYALMTEAEVSEMTRKIMTMKENGTYEQFVTDRENLSKICGNTTLIVATKK